MKLDDALRGGAAAGFVFTHEPSFTPIQMEVQRASKLRGEVPARVYLLGRDRAMYRTYQIPGDERES